MRRPRPDRGYRGRDSGSFARGDGDNGGDAEWCRAERAGAQPITAAPGATFVAITDAIASHTAPRIPSLPATMREGGSPSAPVTCPRQDCPAGANYRPQFLSAATVRGGPVRPGLACSLLSRWLLSSLLVVALGGCLFTDPINMAPQLTINPPPPLLWRGEAVTFTAAPSDANGDTVTLEWAHYSNICDNEPDPGVPCRPCPGTGDYLDSNLWPPESARLVAERYDLDKTETDRPFCVWAFARDSHQALRPAVPLLVRPRNHPPIPVIAVRAPIPTPAFLPLYSTVHVSSDGSTDDDESDRAGLIPEWRPLVPPIGSSAKLADCPDDNFSSPRADQCFTPDLPGHYLVTLKMTDRRGETAMTTLDLATALADTFPCISATTPSLNASVISASSDEPVNFNVERVADDGDSFPPQSQTLKFRWFEQSSAGDWSRPPVSIFGNYDVPASSHSVGDEVKVRVEILDRNFEAIDRFLQACDQDVCSSPPGCFQRFTWTIRYR